MAATVSPSRGALRYDERVAHLLDLLTRQASASLAEMQAVTGASLPTLRRDLATLERQGALHRTRGGARLVPSSGPLDEEFELRRRRNASAKGAIAVAAARMVAPRMALFLQDGSTALALAEELRLTGLPLSIATSALNVAQRLAGSGEIEVTVLGGHLRRTSFGVVGPMTTSALGQLRADIAFLPPDLLDQEGPVSNSLADAEVAQHMSRHAARTVVIADASKYGAGGTARIARWEDVDDLVTDAVAPALGPRLEEAGVRVTVAPMLRGGAG